MEGGTFAEDETIATYTFKPRGLAVTNSEFKLTDNIVVTALDAVTGQEIRATAKNTAVTVKITLADYTDVEAAIARFNAIDKSMYTETSVSAVEAAIATVDYTKTANEQEAVNEMAAAINNAIDALELKYVVEVDITTDGDYAGATKLVLVYTNVDGITFDYNGAQMFDVSDAGYKYNDVTEFTYVYGLVVDSDGKTTLDEYKAEVTVDYEGTAEKIDYTVPYDVNLIGGVNWLDIISIYSVADHDDDIFVGVNEYMKLIIKADTNRDKVVRADDTDKLYTAVYGGK